MKQRKTNIREKFKVYPHNSNYLVGQKGTVFSLAYMRPIGVTSMYGYICVKVNGHWIGAHRMVWMSWVDPIIEPGLEINHLNGLKDCNELSNLEKVTRAENFRHAYEVLGAIVRGEKHGKWKGYWLVDGVRYTTAKEAAQSTGMGSQLIRKRCLAGVDGYSFLPVQVCKLSA